MEDSTSGIAYAECSVCSKQQIHNPPSSPTTKQTARGRSYEGPSRLRGTCYAVQYERGTTFDTFGVRTAKDRKPRCLNRCRKHPGNHPIGSAFEGRLAAVEIKQRGGGLSGRHKTGQDLKQMRETKDQCNTENELPGVPAVGASCTTWLRTAQTGQIQRSSTDGAKYNTDPKLFARSAHQALISRTTSNQMITNAGLPTRLSWADDHHQRWLPTRFVLSWFAGLEVSGKTLKGHTANH